MGLGDDFKVAVEVLLLFLVAMQVWHLIDLLAEVTHAIIGARLLAFGRRVALLISQDSLNVLDRRH